MRWGKGRDSDVVEEVDDLVDLISTTAAELRAEADRRATSHAAMNEIAERLERRVTRLREERDG